MRYLRDHGERRDEFRSVGRSAFLARMFERFDGDGDGRLSEEERSNAPRFVRVADVDKDGFISRSEFVRGSLRSSSAFAGADQNRDGRIAKDETTNRFLRDNFDQYDADQDGFLSKEEHAELMRGTSKERSLAMAGSVIRRLDRNEDGQLQEEEFPAGIMRYSFEYMDANSDGSVTANEWAEYMPTFIANRNANADPDESLRRLFSRRDKNEDGEITSDEVTTGFWKRVSTFDTNEDGAISEEEFRLGEGKREHAFNVRSAGQRLLGVRLSEAEKGLRIARVIPGSPAYEAKILADDVLLRIGDNPSGHLKMCVSW